MGLRPGGAGAAGVAIQVALMMRRGPCRGRCRDPAAHADREDMHIPTLIADEGAEVVVNVVKHVMDSRGTRVDWALLADLRNKST